MTYKIAYIGTHATGKSTFVLDTAKQLKRNAIDTEIIKEVARECPLPINEQASKDAQEWIIYMQHIREIEEEKIRKPKAIVCDRSVLDGYVYYHEKFGENKILEDFVKEKIKDYNELWMVPIEFSKMKDDGVRSTDKEFQKNIDKKFYEITDKLGIEYKTFKNEEEVYENILNAFNKDKVENI